MCTQSLCKQILARIPQQSHKNPTRIHENPTRTHKDPTSPCRDICELGDLFVGFVRVLVGILVGTSYVFGGVLRDGHNSSGIFHPRILRLEIPVFLMFQEGEVGYGGDQAGSTKTLLKFNLQSDDRKSSKVTTRLLK